MLRRAPQVGQMLASMRHLHRNGRGIVRVAIARRFVEMWAVIQVACLMRKRGNRKGRRVSFLERSMIGMSGEIALHFYLCGIGSSSRILLPALSPTAIDHLLYVNGRESRIQSKTSCSQEHKSFTTVPPSFKLSVDKRDDLVDWYSWAIVYADNMFSETATIDVDLVAFAPAGFVSKSALTRRGFGRSVLLGEVSPEISAPLIDDQAQMLPREVLIAQDCYERLSSSCFEDWLLEGLDLIGSPREADRVLEMVMGTPGLSETVYALWRTLQPMQTRRAYVSDAVDAVESAVDGALVLGA